MLVGNYLAATFKIGTNNFDRFEGEQHMRLLLRTLADAIGSNVEGIITHKFIPHGITAIAIISESHISLHTFPEKNILTLDIFCCNKYRELSKAVDHINTTYNVIETRVKMYKR